MPRSNSFDGKKINILKNWRINPLTAAERIELGNTLDSRHIGLPVFDTTDQSLYFWTGTIWKSETGTGGGGGGSTLISVYNEHLQGSTNGINLVFTTASPYIAGSTRVKVNGVGQTPGAGNDYLESDAQEITFLNLLPVNANLRIDYDINA